MAKKYRIAAIGFAHSHIDGNLKDFASCGDRVEFVAAADVKPRIPSVSKERGTRIDELREAVELYGFKTYDDYEKLLDENRIDIALVCAENAFHPMVSENLLRRGIHVVLDYCCYGACMSCWFTGQAPVSAYGLKANFDSPYGSAEDYAAITVRFPAAVALLEGSWTTVNGGVAAGPLLYGTKGTLVVQDGAVLVYKTRHSNKPDGIINPDPLPAGRENLGKETLYHLDTGEPLFPMLDLPLNLAAMSILDAGARSAQSGRMEPVNDGVWCTGADPWL